MLSSVAAITLVSLLGAISPGPDFFIVMKNSLSYSRKSGYLTTLGISLALLFHLTYTVVGIGILMTEGSFFYLVVKYAGAGYLFYIGFKGLMSSFKGQKLDDVSDSRRDIISSFTAFKQGFLTNLLNPKCALFFVSLFSQFIVVDTPLSLKIGFACINWSISLAWFLLLSYLITGKFFMSHLNSFRIYIDRVMGCVFMSLSLKLFLT